MIELDTRKLNSREKLAVSECDKVTKMILSGNYNASAISNMFYDLSKLDYRSDDDITIDKYVYAFINGAWVTVEVPSIERTARNSPRYKEVRDATKWCSGLKREHFVRVQKAFFKRYKVHYDNLSTYDKPAAVKASEIVKIMKTMNSKGEVVK